MIVNLKLNVGAESAIFYLDLISVTREQASVVTGGGMAAEGGDGVVEEVVVVQDGEDTGAVLDASTAGASVASAAAGGKDISAAWYRTTLCRYHAKGACKHGDSCVYAHSAAELRPRPDGTLNLPTAPRLPREDRSNGGGPAVLEALANHEGPIQVCLLHTPRHWKNVELRKMFDKLGLTYTHAKKQRGCGYGFVTFPDVSALAAAVPRCLSVEFAKPRQWETQEPQHEDGNNSDDSEKSDDEKPTTDDADRPCSSGRAPTDIRDVVTPLWQAAYNKQLETKLLIVAQALKKISNRTRKLYPRTAVLPDWVQQSYQRGRLACPLVGIIPSPEVNGYRNKVEMTAGVDANGQRTVGFQLGMYKDGITAIAEATECPNVSVIAKQFGAVFRDFIRSSKLEVWDKKTNVGVWRMLTVREGRHKQTQQMQKQVEQQALDLDALSNPMEELDNTVSNVASILLVVQLCPDGIDPNVLQAECDSLVDALVQHAKSSAPPLPLSSLNFQYYGGMSNSAPEGTDLQVAKAEGVTFSAHLLEHMCNLQFRVSPTAFFQVNTLAAERLYRLVGEWAGCSRDSLVLDICCGTGTIGLTLARLVGKVIGIELNPSAVEDAKENARLNDIANCEFICGRAEEVIEKVLYEHAALVDDERPAQEQQAQEPASTSNGEHASASNGATEQAEATSTSSSRKYTNIIAIVDPPRTGLHHSVLRSLRAHRKLQRLIYVSCNPDTFALNAVDLCGPSQDHLDRGGAAGRKRQKLHRMKPFVPVKSVAVDLFPHTQHCEMVTLFER
eukprot:jgi/Chlat1/9292/Chrsp99S08500